MLMLCSQSAGPHWYHRRVLEILQTDDSQQLDQSSSDDQDVLQSMAVAFCESKSSNECTHCEEAAQAGLKKWSENMYIFPQKTQNTFKNRVYSPVTETCEILFSPQRNNTLEQFVVELTHITAMFQCTTHGNMHIFSSSNTAMQLKKHKNAGPVSGPVGCFCS